MHIIIRVQCHLKTKESSDELRYAWRQGEGGKGVGRGRVRGEGGKGVGRGRVRGGGGRGVGVSESRGRTSMFPFFTHSLVFRHANSV